MSIFVKSGGLFCGSDVVWLSNMLNLESNYLVDSATGARHQAASQALPALLDLVRPVRLDDWLAVNKHLSLQQKAQLMTFLDSIAGVGLRRSWLGTLGIWVKRIAYRVSGVPLSWNSRRYSSSSGLLVVVAKAMSPLVLLISLTLIGVYGTGAFDLAQAVGISLIYLAVIYGSTVAHEYVHWWLANRQGANSCYVVRGLRIGLLHTPLPERADKQSAILGPVAGALCAVVMASVLAASSFSAVIVGLGASLAMFHLLSWLPMYGDGAVIWNNNIARKKHA